MRSDRDIEVLRERLKAMQTDGGWTDDARFDLGCEASDRHLGGLSIHALHEVHAATTSDATAALGFALGLVRRAAGDRPVLWGVQAMAGLETGHIHGPGLRELGLDQGGWCWCGSRSRRICWRREKKPWPAAPWERCC